MPTFNIDVDFEVYCAECGAGLCNGSDTDTGRRGPRVNVAPCECCLDAAHTKGYEEGLAEHEEAQNA